MMRARSSFLSLAVLLFLCGAGAVSAIAQETVIEHTPIPFAVRGQALTMKAKVTGAEEPASVTLYYALFRDAAPFRVAMKSTGLGYYVGTIDSGLLTGVESVSYYIEAQARNGSITETPWYEVDFRQPGTAAPIAPSSGTGSPAAMPTPAPAAPAPVIPAPSVSPSGSSSDSNWKTPALIAGGAAVVLGGAYLLSDSDSGSDDDNGGGGGGGTTNDPSGTYAGTVTTCFTPEGGVATCDSAPMQILVDSQGIVFSETLYPPQQLTSLLSGNAFTLTASVNEGGTNGTVNFEGAVVGNKVLGSVSGTATIPGGSGAYSGSFSATKQ